MFMIPSACKYSLRLVLLASVVSCHALSTTSRLLTRWAEAPHHNLELSNSELSTYIATGKLPEEALAQLQENPSLAQLKETSDGQGGKPEKIPAKAKKEDKAYLEKGNKAVKEMQEFKEHLNHVRYKAESAFYKVKKQEDRLIANFIPVAKLLMSLTQEAATTAAKAEVRTMMNRLTRMHYKQVGALDRSATYWMEVAEREKEARRVAEAKYKIQTEQVGLSADQAKQIFSLTQKRNNEKAEMDAWFAKYWAQLEEKEKMALDKGTPFHDAEVASLLQDLNKLGSTKHLEEAVELSSSGSSNNSSSMNSEKTAAAAATPLELVATGAEAKTDTAIVAEADTKKTGEDSEVEIGLEFES